MFDLSDCVYHCISCFCLQSTSRVACFENELYFHCTVGLHSIHFTLLCHMRATTMCFQNINWSNALKKAAFQVFAAMAANNEDIRKKVGMFSNECL